MITNLTDLTNSSNSSNLQSFFIRIRFFPYYANLAIALMHLIGFVNLMWWAEFSGIGDEARKMNELYGKYYFIAMNAAAMFMFFVIAYIFKKNAFGDKYRIIAILFSMVYLLRGIGGFVMVMMNQTGTADLFYESVFSLLALTIGISAMYNNKLGRN